MLMEQRPGKLGNYVLEFDRRVKPAIVNGLSHDALERRRDSGHETTLRWDGVFRSGGIIEQRSENRTKRTPV